MTARAIVHRRPRGVSMALPLPVESAVERARSRARAELLRGGRGTVPGAGRLEAERAGLVGRRDRRSSDAGRGRHRQADHEAARRSCRRGAAAFPPISTSSRRCRRGRRGRPRRRRSSGPAHGKSIGELIADHEGRRASAAASRSSGSPQCDPRRLTLQALPARRAGPRRSGGAAGAATTAIHLEQLREVKAAPGFPRESRGEGHAAQSAPGGRGGRQPPREGRARASSTSCPETVLVIRGDELLTADQVVGDDDDDRAAAGDVGGRAREVPQVRGRGPSSSCAATTPPSARPTSSSSSATRSREAIRRYRMFEPRRARCWSPCRAARTRSRCGTC